MNRLGFIGAGNMAYALVGGICKSDISFSEITIFDVDKGKYDRFNFDKVLKAEDHSFIPKCDYLFLCMKPQNFADELPVIKKYIRKECVIITIAAGISSSYICEKLGYEAKIVRVMPNTPLMLSSGASAISANPYVSQEEAAFACSVFSSLGVVARIDESQMNAIISVNGSSPAYVYLMIKAMADASVRLGISYETALPLICATFKGSVKMIEESGFTPEELIKMVSSPGGTTLKALDVFKNSEFEDIIYQAMLSCKNRADELSAQ